MMQGTIIGGWEYVYAAYSLTALILSGYAVSVFLRHRQERARLADPDSALVPGASPNSALVPGASEQAEHGPPS